MNGPINGPNHGQMHRRKFLRSAAATGIALGASRRLAALGKSGSASEKVIVAVVGTNGRGTDLAQGFARLRAADVAYVCDVDEKAADKARKAAAGHQDKKPKAVEDFRKVLDDPSVDASLVATPNHWHGPATILGCAAGKHVYVEKPCSHNPREGELMVEAARKHQRVVQVGTQRRSWDAIIEAMERLHKGVIGRVYYSTGWYYNSRGPTGRATPASVPKGLNYDLWQGPAPRREYRENRIHYKWHWFWHWGNGELGNNGVHALDLCRWGLGVNAPSRVTSSGGRYHFQDDQETPDTNVVTFDFEGGKSIKWEGLSCNKHGTRDGRIATFHGDKGSLVIKGSGYTVYDAGDKGIENVPGPRDDSRHFLDFTNCIRSGGRAHCDVADAHWSTLLCHLGNIAYRTGHTLHCDPESGRIREDKQAMALWSREYKNGWEPTV